MSPHEEKTRQLINQLILTTMDTSWKMARIKNEELDPNAEADRAYALEAERHAAKKRLTDHLFPKEVIPGIVTMDVVRSPSGEILSYHSLT